MEQTRVVEREAGLQEEPSFVEQGGNEEALQSERSRPWRVRWGMQALEEQRVEDEIALRQAPEAEDLLPYERAWLPQDQHRRYIPLARDWRPAWDGHKTALRRNKDIFVNASGRQMSSTRYRWKYSFEMDDGRTIQVYEDRMEKYLDVCFRVVRPGQLILDPEIHVSEDIPMLAVCWRQLSGRTLCTTAHSTKETLTCGQGLLGFIWCWAFGSHEGSAGLLLADVQHGQTVSFAMLGFGSHTY